MGVPMYVERACACWSWKPDM